MNDNQRIDELKKHLKLSSNALAKALNLKSPQIFYDIKAGKCGISKDLATKIQDKYFNVNMSWLLTGEGEMLKENVKSVLGIGNCDSGSTIDVNSLIEANRQLSEIINRQSKIIETLTSKIL